MCSSRLLYLALAISGSVHLAFAGTPPTYEDPLDDPAIHKLLRGMDSASTWYHPDQFAEFAAVKRYVNKAYVGALKYFEISAMYADKFSQLSIGLMYVNGEGVAKDPVTGYAWLDIAAEREYPDFVATRDRVKALLTPDEMQRAQVIRDRLALNFADAVAKPRMAQQLRFGMYQLTGSRVGFNQGVLHMNALGTLCKGGVNVGGVDVPEAGCGGDDIYARSRWDPATYFAYRDAQWKATVTVGKIKNANTGVAPTAPSTAEGTDDDTARSLPAAHR
jgi:hypothetical protein